ncbi:hypothetical protein HYV43_05975 [Candidatus Micrarchaeota archaeon]|nr:hypothetical protein [Candidatus Micrarchaeota archaeon]
MVVICASAPNKLHLCGEHSVVYGGKALIAPVEIGGRRNVVTLMPTDAGVFRFSGDLGSASIDGERMAGDAIYFPILEVASYVCRQLGEAVPSLDAVLEYSGSPKGTGSSASIPVALAVALYTFFNHVPSRQELYDAGFVGDNAYHGGKSSGGDVAAVLSDQAQSFHRVFEAGGSVKAIFESVDLHLPSGTSLLLVSSSRGQPNASTAAQIELFAKAHGIAKKPADLSDAERIAIAAPFDAVVSKIQSLCREDADAQELGSALEENHALLQSVTTDGIEEALRTARDAGALGGKLIGAGGEGGALVVLCLDDSVEKVQDALRGRGFASWPVQLARKGPTVDDIRPD